MHFTLMFDNLYNSEGAVLLFEVHSGPNNQADMRNSADAADVSV